MEKQIKKIELFYKDLEPKIKLELEKNSKIKQFKKNEFLCQFGEICYYSFTILNGISRKFYFNGNSEITTEIFFPDDLAVSFKSYLHLSPSDEAIQALSNCTVSMMDSRTFHELKLKFPILKDFDLLLTELYALSLETKISSIYHESAVNKYLYLIRKEPSLFQELPLKIIASYLNITVETLSRIRKQIAS